MAKRYTSPAIIFAAGPLVYYTDYAKLEADRDQISLTLAVAKADRDKWFNRARVLEAELAEARKPLEAYLEFWTNRRIAALEAALRGLYVDNVDYLRLNNLGGYDNHWLVAARKALGLTAETKADG